MLAVGKENFLKFAGVSAKTVSHFVYGGLGCCELFLSLHKTFFQSIMRVQPREDLVENYGSFCCHSCALNTEWLSFPLYFLLSQSDSVHFITWPSCWCCLSHWIEYYLFRAASFSLFQHAGIPFTREISCHIDRMSVTKTTSETYSRTVPWKEMYFPASILSRNGQLRWDFIYLFLYASLLFCLIFENSIFFSFSYEVSYE